ncbi:Vesicle coat protein involved in Golgi to plasma membrane transport domain containing protein [Rhypophila decipiens]
MLIPHLQLCLAHYCDLHGPTPLMVTEGIPVHCPVCYDEGTIDYREASDGRSRTNTVTSSAIPGYASTAISEALRRMDIGTAARSSSAPASQHEAPATELRRSKFSGPESAIETPPHSPSLLQTPSQQKPRGDSGFRRTYDEYVTRRAGPCDNCALTLPKRQETGGEVGVEQPEQGPTLRTRAPCARVFQGMDIASPPPSQSSSQSSFSSPSEDEPAPRPNRPHRRSGTAVSMASHSSTSSSAGMNAHTHYLEYTSTHEPISPTSFSIVRASCLRTLSLETLPRPPATAPSGPGSSGSTPCASPSTPAFVTTHSVGSAASGGPIFFGDPGTGYTTAYIFRIPDVHARGHKRVYAFLALSTHRERLAMKSFAFVAAAFRDMASWIQEMAEAEAERRSAGSAATSPITAGPGYGSIPTELTAPISSGSGGSSFLMGGGGLSRRLGGGFGGSGVALKQRGLAELVGLPDFFIELHTRFVRLLLEMRVVLGS